MVASTPRFPLPKTYFDSQGPPLTAEQQLQYTATARARIDAVLQAERDHVRLSRRQVDPAQWKLLKKRKLVRIYKRRQQDASQPSMLGVGCMGGTLEDLLYGTYDKSYEEMKTTMSYVDIFTKDCNVLHNLELATPEDPFHYVGLKWTLSQLPGKLFVKPRDWCYIEAMGIEKDAEGKRFGYTIVHSVDVPNCPPFDPKAVVRGRGSLSFVYRESETEPGVVEIFAQGLFDPAGELIQYFSVIMTTEIFSGQALTVRCAEAKKLTLLALRNYQRTGSSREPIQKTCYLCVRSDSLFKSLKLCNICGATTCEKCRVKRLIFMGANHSVCEVSCCQSCILDAKMLQVRPAEEAFSMHSGGNRIPQDFVHTTSSSTSTTLSLARKGSASHESSNSNSNSSIVPLTLSQDAAKLQHDDSIASDFSQGEMTDDDQFTSYSSMDETDFEKMIEAMIDQRHYYLGSVAGSSVSSSRANSQQLDFVAGSTGAVTTVATAVAALPVAQPVPVSTEEQQAAMFQKLLALQSAASEVYKITQANEEIMKNLS